MHFTSTNINCKKVLHIALHDLDYIIKDVNRVTYPQCGHYASWSACAIMTPCSAVKYSYIRMHTHRHTAHTHVRKHACMNMHTHDVHRCTKPAITDNISSKVQKTQAPLSVAPLSIAWLTGEAITGYHSV